MAIEGNGLPKGVSNSAKMGATPGTQQTAMNNVGGPKLNFEMPAGPQLAKQANSSFQSSITPKMPIPMGGAPAKPGSAHTGNLGRRPTDSPVITNGLPMDNGRGYNVFAGMDAMQIGQMNSDMGLSNMTALPQFKPEANQFYTGGQMMGNNQLMHHGDPDPPIDNDPYDNYGEDDSVYLDRLAEWTEEERIHRNYVEAFNETMDANNAAGMDNAQLMHGQHEDEEGNPTDEEGNPTAESLLYENYDAIKDNPPGFGAEKLAKMESKLDEKYARELQTVLSGIDRQMAMMGTFGSGAHSFSINNATAQALGAMAAEYADLEKANALQYEKEYQQNIENMNALSDRLLNIEGLEGNEIKEILKLEDSLVVTVDTPLSSYIASEIKKFSPNGYTLWYGFLNDMSGDLFEKLAYGEMTEEEVIIEYKKRGQLLMAAMTSYTSKSATAQLDIDAFFEAIGQPENSITIEY